MSNRLPLLLLSINCGHNRRGRNRIKRQQQTIKERKLEAESNAIRNELIKNGHAPDCDKVFFSLSPNMQCSCGKQLRAGDWDLTKESRLK